MTHDLTDDEACVLRELYAEHTALPYKHPQAWLRASHISGPMGNDQAKALRSLLKRGLVTFKYGSYANRYRRKLWRLTEDGFALGFEWAKASALRLAERAYARRNQHVVRSGVGHVVAES